MSSINFFEKVSEIENELVEIQGYLHQNAEVGFELDKTPEFVKNKLEDMGLEVTHCGKAGLVTTIGKGKGKTFLLRADMDALPIKDESDVCCVCKTGNMHACGHDFHTSMLLGAAKLLKNNETEIK